MCLKCSGRRIIIWKTPPCMHQWWGSTITDLWNRSISLNNYSLHPQVELTKQRKCAYKNMLIYYIVFLPYTYGTCIWPPYHYHQSVTPLVQPLLPSSGSRPAPSRAPASSLSLSLVTVTHLSVQPSFSRTHLPFPIFLSLFYYFTFFSCLVFGHIR